MLVDALVGRGVSVDEIAVDVIAPAQRTVGERWALGEYEVADEHAATAVTVAALDALDRRVVRSEPPRGRVVACTADREVHALGVRAVGIGLRARGWDVDEPGAGTDTGWLVRSLRARPPVAVLLSVTNPTSLVDAVLTIERVHAVGVPVLAGGAALGESPDQALRLGAVAWAPEAAAADGVLERWRRERTRPGDVATPAVEALEASDLQAGTAVLFAAGLDAADEVLARRPDVDARTAVLLRTELGRLLDVCAGALLVADPEVVEEQVTWMTGVFLVRGLPVVDLDRVPGPRRGPRPNRELPDHGPLAGTGPAPPATSSASPIAEQFVARIATADGSRRAERRVVADHDAGPCGRRDARAHHPSSSCSTAGTRSRYASATRSRWLGRKPLRTRVPGRSTCADSGGDLRRGRTGGCWPRRRRSGRRAASIVVSVTVTRSATPLRVELARVASRASGSTSMAVTRAPSRAAATARTPLPQPTSSTSPGLDQALQLGEHEARRGVVALAERAVGVDGDVEVPRPVVGRRFPRRMDHDPPHPHGSGERPPGVQPAVVVGPDRHRVELGDRGPHGVDAARIRRQRPRGRARPAPGRAR
ncbi:MAG: B12-binding domain-containing protein [Acidimicrobiia bacterium]|nr:B12-binding domain-containing protein [Acidimicrobiia bacterium]